MSAKSMIERIRRAQASARQKKIAELEGSAELREAAKKQSKRPKNKSLSANKDDGVGTAKPKVTAKDKFKSPGPKPKGNKADAKLDTKPKAKTPRQEKQKALDSATSARQDVTSDIPKLPKTPKPKIDNTTQQPKAPALPKSKLSPTSRKAWRKAKLAELRTALNAPSKPSGVLDDMGEEVPEAPSSPKTPASKAQRVPAFQALQLSQKLVPEMTKALTDGNDVLENAIMAGDLQKIQRALSFLLTKIQEVTKKKIVPLGGTIRTLMQALTPKQAAAKPKLASVVSAAVKELDQLDAEFARSKVLMRMASGKITL